MGAADRADEVAPCPPVGEEGDLAPKPAEPAEPDSIGVALSGGGVRAALFSLGALTGLVDCGVNRKVTNVSSVSGGSIVNAAVAQSCAFSETSPDDFEAVAAPIAKALCQHGAFLISRAAFMAFVRAVSPLVGVIVIVGVAFWSPVAAGMQAIPAEISRPGLAVGIVVLLMFVLFLLRGRLQEGLYSSFLAALPEGSKKRRIKDCAGSSTTHVIVATDLVSAAPVFFSKEFVYCPTFGWGSPGETRTASAVCASAAFPVVFPVRAFSRRKFRFQNGTSSPPYPRRLKLNDGGVYNNLGTDWFRELSRESCLEMWPYGSQSFNRPPTPANWRVVVNAGAASRGSHKVWSFLAIRRTMSVLYDNTVRPRLQTMRENANSDLKATVVIDIAESPYDVARRFAEVDVRSFPAKDRAEARARRSRAEEVVKMLGGREEPYWIDFARQTSSTKTKLTRAGLEAGARMMLHGYLSTVIVMHIIRNVELPGTLRDEGHFLNLAGRQKLDQTDLEAAGSMAAVPALQGEAAENGLAPGLPGQNGKASTGGAKPVRPDSKQSELVS